MALVLFAVTGCKCSDEGAIPERVFAPWDGTWEGRFHVKDGAGNTLTELSVKQRYWSESPTVQRGEFWEKDLKTGETITAKATNLRQGDRLTCRVEKSNGEVVEHTGRWTGEALEWRRDTRKAKELFRERIVTGTTGETLYEIEGWGEYGDGPRLSFFGRYEKRTE